MTKSLSRPLSGAALKIIACISMFADHFCKTFPVSSAVTFILSGIIGRIAFPIFCFLLAEGFFHTHSRKRYICNVLVLAVISEVPFNMAFFHSWTESAWQNTCFTLFLGLLLYSCLDRVQRTALAGTLRALFQLLLIALFAAAAWLLRTDYGFFGIGCLTAFYYLRNLPVQAAFCGCFLLNLDYFSVPAAFLSLIPIHFYNGTRGRQLKYAFYLFYPLHLILLTAASFLCAQIFS